MVFTANSTLQYDSIMCNIHLYYMARATGFIVNVLI